MYKHNHRRKKRHYIIGVSIGAITTIGAIIGIRIVTRIGTSTSTRIGTIIGTSISTIPSAHTYTQV